MKTSTVADWSEILSSIAVVVSLVLLLVEVRDNTRAIERQASVERAARVASPFFESPELRSAIRKVSEVDGTSPALTELSDRYGLSSDEALVLWRHLFEIWLAFEADYRKGDRDEVRRQVDLFVQFKDNEIFVRNFVGFDPEFASMVQQALDANGAQ